MQNYKILVAMKQVNNKFLQKDLLSNNNTSLLLLYYRHDPKQIDDNIQQGCQTKQQKHKKAVKMVQVIYTFKQGRYPFGKDKQSMHTYMEYLLYAKDEQEVLKYRQFSGIMKKLRHENIMRLQRVLKEDVTFHLIYEFHNKSLEQRLKEITQGEQLVGLFVQLENVFDCLVERGIKAQLYMEFMGVDEDNNLKIWIKPDEVEILPTVSSSSKTLRKQLWEYYDTERTRIHLQIEQIFQSSQNNLSKRIFKNKQIQATSIQQIHHQALKPKAPNFVIEGNTLVFLNTSGEKGKTTKQDNSLQATSQPYSMTKTNHLIYQQRPIAKTEIPSSLSKASLVQQQAPDISKMSVAEKVLYYKKLKQQQNPSDSNQIVVRDSSRSQHDLYGTDSNIQIKTQMINKNKIKIITSEEVQVQGNSDDDLEKLARQKLAQIKTQKEKGKANDSSTDMANKSHTSGNSQKVQKKEDSFKQINSKIAQAKLKAKNILQKYGQKLKK